MADDRRERLERLRDQLQDAISTATLDNPNMLPQLAGQYRATLADIAALPPEVKVVAKRDELAARRKDRVATATPPTPATGKAVKRRG